MSQSDHASPGNSGQGPPFETIDILGITAGLGCDGDTIAMTLQLDAAMDAQMKCAVLGCARRMGHG